MTTVERTMKQKHFATLLFDIGRNLTREQICEMVGISENTYYEWSRDPSLAELIGMESWRVTEATRLYAQAHKGTALRTLVDVMQNSSNDVARVRAAELVMSIGDAPDAGGTTDKNAEDLAKILSKGPTLIIANPGMIENKQGDLTIESGSFEDEDVVDAEVREAD